MVSDPVKFELLCRVVELVCVFWVLVRWFFFRMFVLSGFFILNICSGFV